MHHREKPAMKPGKAVLPLLVLLIGGCSTISRRGEENDTDDTDDTESDSDSVMIVPQEPIQLASSNNCWGVASVLTEGRLAVSWTSPFLGDDPTTLHLAVLHWDHPEEVAQAEPILIPPLYEYTPPFQQIWEGNGRVLSLAYLSTVHPSDCRIIQAAWDFDAALVDGPHEYQAFEDFHPTPPNGTEPVNEDGRVTLATISFSVDGETEGDEAALFAVERHGPEAFRETLVHEVYDWSEQAVDAGENSTLSFFPSCGTFEDDGGIVGFCATGHGHIAFARSTLDGEVSDPPRLAVAPPLPQETMVDLTCWGAAFARSGDRVVGIVPVHNQAVQHESHHYSVAMDLDGGILSGPHELGPSEFNFLEGHSGIDLVPWRDRFAFCLWRRDSLTGQLGDEGEYVLILLSQDGLPIGDPLVLFSNASIGTTPSCSIEVVDEATLAVVLAVNRGAPDSGLNGPYLVVVTDPGLQ